MPDTDQANLDALRGVPLFSHLDEDGLATVLRVAKEFGAPAGHVLVEAKREASGAFVILTGTVTVEAGGKHIALGAGEVVGELALLTEHAARSARVQTTSAVTGLAIGRNDFVQLLEAEPALAVSLLQVLASRLAAMAAH